MFKSNVTLVTRFSAKPYLGQLARFEQFWKGSKIVKIAQASELDNCPQLAANETGATDTTTEAVFS